MWKEETLLKNWLSCRLKDKQRMREFIGIHSPNVSELELQGIS